GGRHGEAEDRHRPLERTEKAHARNGTIGAKRLPSDTRPLRGCQWLGAGEDSKAVVLARRSSSSTSVSVVCVKSSYHRPTAWKSGGAATQVTSSAMCARRAAVSGGQ